MRIGLIGATGKIGTILSRMIPSMELSGGASSKTSDAELEKIVVGSDVLIDFSVPDSTLKTIATAARHKVPMVTGTTGLSEKDFARIKEFSRTTPVLHAANFSLGIQLMAILVKKCSDVLADFDFGILDRHHNRKKDAPSGTALFLADHMSKPPQIVSLREGNIHGEHVCDFVGENEMLSVSHRVFNREIFADGALKCAQWIVGKSPRLYSMKDYLEDVTNV
ncbi:MAG: 4-hydroxy-tetrahydrodipicolinate reductase [Holosporaceae bacterium]|nr:4-hydroxy-tetrahydrodipicolinate reductase [Holosporaceae bacterium]